jgi:hypothetical protein
MSNPFASEAGHWYGWDGPAYEVPNKSKPGQMRPTTLTDARKLDLVPGVSDILKCEYKWALENWKFDQIIGMANANPSEAGEPLPDYCARIKRLWGDEAAKAPDLGSLIHKCIEKHLRGETYDQTYRDHVMGALDAVGEWCGMDGLSVERWFRHHLGYGGKCDIHKKLDPFPGFVADFKSKDFGAGELPLAWDNHAMQLAAYREGFGMPKARGAIIYVSTQVAGLTHLVELNQDVLDKGWRMFCALLDYWKAKNDF